MKIQFERHPGAICAVLTGAGACDRIAEVDRASDALRVFALDVDVAAFTTLDALLTFARVVLVEIEQRADGWCVEVAYWRAALGALAQYETEAPSLAEALARCVRALAGQ